MPYSALDAALRRFSLRADVIRQDLFYCDITSPQSRTRNMRRGIHAASYVYIAAALEAYVTDALAAIVDEINSTAIQLPDLRFSLFAMSSAHWFESLQDVRGLKKWSRRVEIMSTIDDPAACVLSTEHLPLDGRTIRPDHLRTIWMVFGFSGDSIPSPRHGLALRDLAESRNAVAHGSEDAAVIAGQRSIGDTLALLARTEEVVLHLYYVGVDYLDSGGYRR